MPVKSTIKTLPEAVLARLNFMLAEDALTIDQVVAWLDEQGVPRSRSAVGRYKQDLDKVARRLRESREITTALTKELGDAAAQGKQGRLLVEMARTLVFDMMMKMQDVKAGLSAMDVAFLGKGLAELGRALRFDQDFETKVREQVAKEERQKAAETVDKVAKSQGLTAEQAAFIRGSILGVPVEGQDG
ncbi:DUF3486 family protein [Shumkonia mesophila]|uniref:DUF3486 family protein n=1 Tax=Shumkonia mesophila TaxID=2838854 RepID=UPI0029350EEA|nr:DUF3486 family protein [Shumkonia mesophila]